MLGATVVVAVFDLVDRRGRPRRRSRAGGLPALTLPDVGDVDLWALLPAALGIAVVGYSDNVLTGRAFAARHRETIDSDQEFLALGAANVATGLFQGFPISSSGSRTVIADTMGARTQLHSLVSLVLVVATLLWLGPSSRPSRPRRSAPSSSSPRSGSSTSRSCGGSPRFRRSELRAGARDDGRRAALRRAPRRLGAIALSVLDLLRRIVHPHDGVLGYVPDVAGMHDIDDHPNARAGARPRRLPLRLAALLRQRRRLHQARAGGRRPGVGARAASSGSCSTPRRTWRWTSPPSTRSSGCAATLDAARHRLRDGPRQAGPAARRSRPAGFVERVGADLIFPTLPTAVAAYAAWYEREHGSGPPGLRIPPVPEQPEPEA